MTHRTFLFIELNPKPSYKLKANERRIRNSAKTTVITAQKLLLRHGDPTGTGYTAPDVSLVEPVVKLKCPDPFSIRTSSPSFIPAQIVSLGSRQ